MANKGWWLASPNREYQEYSLLFDVYKIGGRLNSSDPDNPYWYRPIVCIPTNTFNEKYELTGIVTNGLMRYYDARNNLGNGKHSDTTTTWKDLSGHQDGIINGGANFTENCLQLDGEDDWVNLGEVNPDYATWEATLEIVSFPVTVDKENYKWLRLVGNWNARRWRNRCH